MKQMKKIGNLLKEWVKYHWRKLYMGMITAVILFLVTTVLGLFDIKIKGNKDEVESKPVNTQEYNSQEHENQSEYEQSDEDDDNENEEDNDD